MQFEAKARYVWGSPYKLRPLADVVRGKNARYALDWLQTYKTKRALPIQKLIASAVANAQHLNNVGAEQLVIHEIRVDQGPAHDYFKPGAMGRAMMRTRRSCHIHVVLKMLEKHNEKKNKRG